MFDSLAAKADAKRSQFVMSFFRGAARSHCGRVGFVMLSLTGLYTMYVKVERVLDLDSTQ